MVTEEDAGPMTPTMFLTFFVVTLGHTREDAFNCAESEKGVLSKWKKGEEDMIGEVDVETVLLDPIELLGEAVNGNVSNDDDEEEEEEEEYAEGGNAKGEYEDVSDEAKRPLVSLLM